jgi:glycosyltransferase involved in cell wall biosynthesis
LENKKLLIVANVDWFFISHRLCIAEQAVKEGWVVYVAAEDSGRSNEITEKGINFINFPFSRSGVNLIKEYHLLQRFKKMYRHLNPDVIHHVTLKPVIYGSLAAKNQKMKGVLNAVSGLGYNFTSERKGIVAKIMISFMKSGFKHPNMQFIFQNQDDYNELKNLGVFVERNLFNFIKGSGVDLDRFTPKPNQNKRFTVLLPTRMLWDKGVAELRKATDILKVKYKGEISFKLAGLADEENKAGVPASYLKEWEDGDFVEWIGYQKDMASVYQNSDLVILPSYREGMPKTLIEACASGKAIVTTNAIGCRECVDEGVNGFKVPVGSTIELAEAIEKIYLDKELCVAMGKASRIKAEKEFDQVNVINRHLEIYNNLLNE